MYVCKNQGYYTHCVYVAVDDNPFLQWKSPGIGRYLFMTVMVGTAAFVALLIKEYELTNKVRYNIPIV